MNQNSTNNNYDNSLPISRGWNIFWKDYFKKLRFYILLLAGSMGMTILLIAGVLSSGTESNLNHYTSIIELVTAISFGLLMSEQFRKVIFNYKELLDLKKENTRWSRSIIKFKLFDIVKYMITVIGLGFAALAVFYNEQINMESIKFGAKILLIIILPLSLFKGSPFLNNLLDELIEKMLKGITSILDSLNISHPIVERKK